MDCSIGLSQLRINRTFGVRIELQILSPGGHTITNTLQVRQKINIDLIARKIPAVDLFSHQLRHGVSWYNIETPDSYNRDNVRDLLQVDRGIAFDTTKVLDYVQHMTTRWGKEWNLLDDHQYPFECSEIHYVGEHGIMLVNQDFFRNLQSTLSQVITDRDGLVLKNEIGDDMIQKGVQALMRVTHFCFRMNEMEKAQSRGMSYRTYRRSEDTLDCRLVRATLHYGYFELAFGAMDQFVKQGNTEVFVNYLRILAKHDLVENWLPTFAQNLFCKKLEQEKIQVIVDAVDTARAVPADAEGQMQLMADYVYTVSCKGIIKVIRENLYYFGIIPSIQPMMWLNFDQFRSIFYIGNL